MTWSKVSNTSGSGCSSVTTMVVFRARATSLSDREMARVAALSRPAGGGWPGADLTTATWPGWWPRCPGVRVGRVGGWLSASDAAVRPAGTAEPAAACGSRAQLPGSYLWRSHRRTARSRVPPASLLSSLACMRPAGAQAAVGQAQLTADTSTSLPPNMLSH
jgi:hypothetical protein